MHQDAIREALTQHGESLEQVSLRAPLLVVFLRHFGCALCREVVADVARHRGAIAATGTAVAFVHMHPESRADAYFSEYGLGDVLRVSDPGRRLYQAFGLLRVAPTHWLSWAVLQRYIDAIFRGGHRPGYVGGDVLQMPGAFLLHKGQVVEAFRPESVAERFDVVAWVAFLEQLDARSRAG
jgi:hypothetical protein